MGVIISLRKHITGHVRTFDVRTEVRLPAYVIKAAGLRPLNIILLLIFSFNYWPHNTYRTISLFTPLPIEYYYISFMHVYT